MFATFNLWCLFFFTRTDHISARYSGPPWLWLQVFKWRSKDRIKYLIILTVSVVAAVSEGSSFSFLLLPLLTQPWPVVQPIRLAPTPCFQLFLQASRLISVIKFGDLWQQLRTGKESQACEACQHSVENWSGLQLFCAVCTRPGGRMPPAVRASSRQHCPRSA